MFIHQSWLASAGKSSFIAPLPRFFNGIAPEISTHNSNHVRVHPVAPANVNQPVGVRIQALIYLVTCIIYLKEKKKSHAWDRGSSIEVVVVGLPWYEFFSYSVLCLVEFVLLSTKKNHSEISLRNCFHCNFMHRVLVFSHCFGYLY